MPSKSRKDKQVETKKWFVKGTDLEVRRVVRMPGHVKLWYPYINGAYVYDDGPIEEVELR